MRAVSRQEVGQAAWDAFVEASDEAWLWHRYALQDALVTWGRQDLSFAVCDEAAGDAILAVVPLHLSTGRFLGLWPWHILQSMGGPALQNDLGRKHRKKLLDFIRSQALDLAAHHHCAEVNFALSPMAPAYRGERCPRVNPLLEMGCENTLTQTWVVDLRVGEDILWQKLEKRARTAIRKAEKNGVRVRPADRPEDLDTYYDLHCQTYRRTGATPHPRAYFAAIWRDFLPHGYARIFLAEWEGNVVGAENFGVYKGAAIYWTGAASDQGLAVEANSLLQWTAMQWMIRHGLAWYETGEAFPHLQGGKLKGLNDFKRSFGGELYPYYRGRIITRKKTHSAATFLKGLR